MVSLAGLIPSSSKSTARAWVRCTGALAFGPRGHTLSEQAHGRLHFGSGNTAFLTGTNLLQAILPAENGQLSQRPDIQGDIRRAVMGGRDNQPVVLEPNQPIIPK